MFPVLSRSLQYLHNVVLQKENPLSLLLVPKCFFGNVCVVGIVVVGVVETKNLSSVLCLDVDGMGGVATGSGATKTGGV